MAHKILLADDSITIQKVVELILAEEDFEIKSVSTGEEALNIVNSFKPDVILADIDMPKMNGYQLCEKIKLNPSTSNIPVILLTGAFEPIDEELAKQVKADDYIVKPFESQELIGKISAVLAVPTVEEVAAGEEIESLIEAEALGIEEAPVEEDLWATEEVSEGVEVGAWPAEEAIASTEEFVEVTEETEEAALAEEVKPQVVEKAQPVGVGFGVGEIEVPSKEVLEKIIKDAVNEKISSLVATLDIKETIYSVLMQSLKDSVEKVLWEVTPDLVERMLKEMLKGSLESLSTEVEKVVWETVPDLAETMITKEIERIRSEF